ncbi:formate dehydrogenase-N subunit gamma [Citrobacter koseri]|uniref:Formate dehydrogenase-N subunit gamma n=1 Tax=Citrobacter koseri TaxID=545 RepID=A0A078L7Z8_CITKO|nr:formate dehydrogenase-N subunit gamma [Citrobacter koseri]
MSKSKMILRTKFIDRACHWTVVISFFLVALSGIALFFPTLQWLTETFGTPQMGGILHPFFGVLIFVVLMFMFVRFVHHNIPDKQDIPWIKGIVEVLKGNEHKVADVGKYNAGQKMMFWSIMSLIFVLLVTGVIIWRPYFTHYFPIVVVRWSLLIHAILIHMYMAFWVKGSITGMIEGKVSRRWAKKHHPRWYRDVEAAEKEVQEKTK